MKLIKFANIYSGAVISTKDLRDDANGYLVVQGSNVQSNGSISHPRHSVEKKSYPDNRILTEQDVLLISRGDNNRAVSVDIKLVGAVPTNSFLIIRVLANHGVMRDYVTWFLNSQEGQRRLLDISRGSNIPYISKKALSDIEVEVPDQSTQALIIKLDQLKRREQEILTELSSNRKKLIEHLMLNYVKKKSTR